MIRNERPIASLLHDLLEISQNFRGTAALHAPMLTTGMKSAAKVDAGLIMASTPPESKSLSVYRTFVVQLHVGAGEGCYSGRVEHVASERALEFSTLAELLEFLADDSSGQSSPRPSSGMS